MIKVLVINTVRFKLNGISAVIKNYFLSMDKEGIRLDFLAIDDPCEEYVDFFKKNGLNCYVFFKKNLISYFYKIIRLCHRERYDVVHIHGNSANMVIELLAVALGGVKVRIAHSHNTSTLHPLTHMIFWPLFSILCTKRLACGVDAGKWLYRNQSFVVMNNGIEVNKFLFSEVTRSKLREELGVHDEEILLGHVGNFIEQKNHTFLIDLFFEVSKLNPEFKLLLISDGVLMPVIKEKVHMLGLDESVIFLGKTTMVQDYLQAMDVFLLPSLHEGLPVVLIEAQAAGLTCLVSDTVAREADLTETSAYLPIDTVVPWIEIIEKKKYCEYDRKAVSLNNILLLESKGYNIGKKTNELRNIYLSAVVSEK